MSMTIIEFQFFIGERDATKNIPFPIKWNDLLDERLDEARISIKQAQTKNFAPLTDVYIKVEDSFGNLIEKYYLVSNDFSLENPPGSNNFDHEIVLIEQTKYLEGFLCDTMTFTNDLGRIYTENAHQVLGSGKLTNNNTGKITDLTDIEGPVQYVTPLAAGSLLSIETAQFFLERLGVEGAGTVKVTKNGTPVELMNSSIIIENASYEISYTLNYILLNNSYTENFSFVIIGIENTDPLPKWTIKTVIERVLEIAETRRQGDSQKFTLDPALYNKLDAILAPEFAFTSNTLKEVLDQIGGFIHAIPRLKGNVISFDFLGGAEMFTV